MADEAGFEPAEGLITLHTVSSGAPSATRPPILIKKYHTNKELTEEFSYIRFMASPIMGAMLTIFILLDSLPI